MLCLKTNIEWVWSHTFIHCIVYASSFHVIISHSSFFFFFFALNTKHSTTQLSKITWLLLRCENGFFSSSSLLLLLLICFFVLLCLCFSLKNFFFSKTEDPNLSILTLYLYSPTYKTWSPLYYFFLQVAFIFWANCVCFWWLLSVFSSFSHPAV